MPERSRAKPEGCALGTPVARSDDAGAVFATAGHLAGSPRQRRDAVSAVPSAAAAPTAVPKPEPTLAVPPFDPVRINPVGWIRHAGTRVAALGPRRLLPAGVTAHCVVAPDARRALRFVHHVEDVQAFHADPAERAAALVRIAARGVPVRLADGGPGLEPLLGAELHALMTTDMRLADAGARERLSVGMRRAALRDHSLGARAHQSRLTPPANAAALPCVTVLLATRRPQFLRWALANVAMQDFPRLELVLALNDDGFSTDAVRQAIATLPCPVRVLRIATERPLGRVLDAASAVADGDLLTKMDDDDLYGSNHIWDLVLAREYSGAQLVAKAAETLYLARFDATVQRFLGGSETYRWRYLAGGTMMIGRRDLDGVGGWRPLPNGVDSALVADVRRAGGAVYRTHGIGYLMLRHGALHAWNADQAELMAGADAVHPGWHPALAGMEGAQAGPGDDPTPGTP